MNEQEKLATALSPLYPPIILPENKSEWNAGHISRSVMRKQYTQTPNIFNPVCIPHKCTPVWKNHPSNENSR